MVRRVTDAFTHGHLSWRWTDAVAHVRFDRPPVNAVDPGVIADFLATIDDLDDPDVRAVVLTGTDRVFCAGADVAVMRDLSRENQSRMRGWVDVQAALEHLHKPVIAAIRGHALGGGAELTLACDLRIVGETTVMGFPEIELGLFPGAGGTQRLPRLVGPHRALRLIVEGTRLTGPQIVDAGLADEVVDDNRVVDVALDHAQRLAAKPTRAIGLLKQAVHGGWGRPLADGLAREWEAALAVAGTADAAEGLQAFLDDRPPTFRGR